MVAATALTDAVPMVAQDGLAGRNNALDIRKTMIGALLGMDGNDDFTARAGVLPRRWTTSGGFTWLSLLPLPQATASRTLEVQRGVAVITLPGEGPYLAYLDATLSVLMDPADPTNPRIDLVYLELVDATGSGGATEHGAYLKVINGTPAGVPAPPAAPANAVELARVTRPAATDPIAASQIDDRRRGAGMAGATRFLLPGDSLTDPGGYPGEQRFRVAPSGSELDHVVDRWGTDSRWHGAHGFGLSTATVDATTYTSTYGRLMSIAIPDPGWRYRVKAAGSIQFHIGPDIGTDIVWKLGTANGPQFGGAAFGQENVGGATFQAYAIAPTGMSGVLSGAQTIVMTMHKRFGPAGNGYQAIASSRSHMSVDVIPV